MWAASEGNTAAADVLLEAGADLKLKSTGGFTPLLFAVRNAHIDTAITLLKHGANVNDVAPDRLQQRLLTTYAVDPMPDEAVRAVASTWKRPRRRARTPAASAISLALVVLFFGSFLGLVVLAMSVR